MIVPIAMARDLTVWYAKEKGSPACRQAAGGCPVPERCVPFCVTRMKSCCILHRSGPEQKRGRMKKHR